MPKYDVSVGYIIVNDDGKFLLIRKTVDGVWDFPKGHFNKGESAELEVAARELCEEVGISTLQIRPVKGFRHEYTFINPDKVHRKIVLYLARCNAEPKLSKEHTQYAWVGLDEAKMLMGFPEQKDALESVKNFL